MTDQGIKVAIRVRPLNDREKNGGQDRVFRCEGNSIYQIVNSEEKQQPQVFSYDHIFDEKTNMEVYKNTAEELVESVMKGINGTIFAC
jgi:hypothetical protein